MQAKTVIFEIDEETVPWISPLGNHAIQKLEQDGGLPASADTHDGDHLTTAGHRTDDSGQLPGMAEQVCWNRPVPEVPVPPSWVVLDR